MVFWLSLRFITFSRFVVTGSRLSSHFASCNCTHEMEYAANPSDRTVLELFSARKGIAEQKTCEFW